MCFQSSSWDSRIRKVTVCVWTIVSGMRDLQLYHFQSPKRFSCMVYASVNSSYTHSPPPQATVGHLPVLSAQEGHGRSWNWLMHYSDGEGNLFKNIILSLTPSLWIIQEKSTTPMPVYIYIGEFSSSKGIHDSIGVWVPLHGFRIPATGFFVSGTSIWIPILLLVAFWINLHVAVLRIPKPRIMDFTTTFQIPRFSKQKFPGFQECGFPYTLPSL